MVAAVFLVSVRTIQRIWSQSKTCSTYASISHRRTKNCGRKRVQVDIDKIRNIPLHQRTILRALACSFKTSKTSLIKLLKSGNLRRHSNAIKPFLKVGNKRSRLQFCLSMLDGGSIPHEPVFSKMHDVIHVDEKWFYLTKKSEKYYLLPNENDPLRVCKNKNFIEKVMFLAAIARLRFDTNGVEVFFGKNWNISFCNQRASQKDKS